MANLNDIKLSSQDILKKEFRNKVKGYDPDEVDSYLDDIISDYETFSQIIEDLYGQIGTLQRELMDSKQKQKESQFTQTQNPDPNRADEVRTYTPPAKRTSFANSDNESEGEISTNMAIIQRISTLERKVYNLEQKVYGLRK